MYHCGQPTARLVLGGKNQINLIKNHSNGYWHLRCLRFGPTCLLFFPLVGGCYILSISISTTWGSGIACIFSFVCVTLFSGHDLSMYTSYRMNFNNIGNCTKNNAPTAMFTLTVKILDNSWHNCFPDYNVKYHFAIIWKRSSVCRMLFKSARIY